MYTDTYKTVLKDAAEFCSTTNANYGCLKKCIKMQRVQYVHKPIIHSVCHNKIVFM